MYNLIAALNLDDRGAYPAVARKVMIPGPALETHLQNIAQQPPSASDDRTVEFGGFKVVDAASNRATILVGFAVGGTYVSSTWTVVWSGGDWKLRPRCGTRVFEAAVEAGHPVADDLNSGSGEGSAEASTPWCTVCGRARPMPT